MKLYHYWYKNITGKKRAQVWKKLKKIVKAVELWNFGTGTLELVELWNLITSWNSGYQPGTWNSWNFGTWYLVRTLDSSPELRNSWNFGTLSARVLSGSSPELQNSRNFGTWYQNSGYQPGTLELGTKSELWIAVWNSGSLGN